MNEFPDGLLLYVLLFAAIMLFNYVNQWIDARRKRQVPQVHVGKSTTQTTRIAEPERAAPARRTLVHRAEPVAAAATVTRAAMNARSLVTGRRNLRRAIIAMTVLGPSRSQEP